MELGSLQCEEAGVRKAPKLEYASTGLQGTCGHRRLIAMKTGKWGACGWAVVQLDHDEEMERLCGMYGSMEPEFEVQRTIKRAAFLCQQKRVIGPVRVHVDNKGIIDGLQRGESKRKKPRAGDHDLTERGILVDVERVKAHRTKKEKEKMTQLERFVTESNEKTHELTKSGAKLDKGFMAEARAETLQQEREKVYAAMQFPASFHCLVEQWNDCEELKPKPKEKWIFVDKKSEETKHQTEWCAEADRHRCMKMWRRKQIHGDAKKCTGPKFLSKSLGKWEGVIWEVMTW